MLPHANRLEQLKKGGRRRRRGRGAGCLSTQLSRLESLLDHPAFHPLIMTRTIWLVVLVLVCCTSLVSAAPKRDPRRVPALFLSKNGTAIISNAIINGPFISKVGLEGAIYVHDFNWTYANNRTLLDADSLLALTLLATVTGKRCGELEGCIEDAAVKLHKLKAELKGKRARGEPSGIERDGIIQQLIGKLGSGKLTIKKPPDNTSAILFQGTFNTLNFEYKYLRYPSHREFF